MKISKWDCVIYKHPWFHNMTYDLLNFKCQSTFLKCSETFSFSQQISEYMSNFHFTNDDNSYSNIQKFYRLLKTNQWIMIYSVLTVISRHATLLLIKKVFRLPKHLRHVSKWNGKRRRCVNEKKLKLKYIIIFTTQEY